MPTDRQRVEQALPAAMLFRVFSKCVTTQAENPEAGEMEFDKQVLDWLRAAALEPFNGMQHEDRVKLTRRAARIELEALKPYEERPVMTVFLVILFWLKDLLDRNVLVMIADSNFDKAVSALLPELEKHAELWESVQRSAGKNAVWFREALEKAGYYR